MVAEELRNAKTNITVIALCPGAVSTEFVSAGDLEGVDVWSSAKSPESVAKVGYDAMMLGKLIAINQLSLRALADWVVPFLPRRAVLR